MTDTIPTLAHAVRIGSNLSLYRERERAELIISHASGGVLVELVDRRDYERERQGRIAAEMALQTKPTPGCSYGGAAGCAGACKSWCGGAA